MAAGDTISGTVVTEPPGTNETERAQNWAELNGYVIELEGQKTAVGDSSLGATSPARSPPKERLSSSCIMGRSVANSAIPVSTTPPPGPTQFTLPTWWVSGSKSFGVRTGYPHSVCNTPYNLLNRETNGIRTQPAFHQLRRMLARARSQLARSNRRRKGGPGW